MDHARHSRAHGPTLWLFLTMRTRRGEVICLLRESHAPKHLLYGHSFVRHPTAFVPLGHTCLVVPLVCPLPNQSSTAAFGLGYR